MAKRFLNMKKVNWVLVSLLIIFGVGLFFRTYCLGSIPYGFHVDEAKAAWNAYSILKTGMDDKGNWLPMYYDSFGDFRPTGLLYTIIPSLMIFGRTIFAVRFPFALIGALTMFPIFLILNELSKNNKKIGIAAAVVISLNPWHIIASRSTSESIVSIFLTLWGIYFLLRTIKNKGWKNVFGSIVFFVLGYFFYHSIRVLAPAFVLVVILIEANKCWRAWFIFGVLVLASVWLMSSKESQGRMSQVSLKSDFNVLYEVTKMPNEEDPGHLFEARAFHNRLAAYARRFAEEYKDYFGSNFLLGTAAKPIRYTVPQIGLLTYFDFIFVILGLFWVSEKKEILVILALLVLAPIPAAATIEDTPNLQRAIYMVPFLVMIAAYGMVGLTKLAPKWKWLLIPVSIGYLVNFIYFCHMYFVHQKMSIATYYRDGGNVELGKKIYEINGNYKNIALTNSPDDLYPWIAFLDNFDPVTFNQSYKTINSGVRKFGNVTFSSEKCPLNSALNKNINDLDNILFVDAEGCVIDSKFNSIVNVNLVDTIHRPDGSPPYYLRTVKLVK